MTTKTPETKQLTEWERAQFATEHSNRVLLYGLPGTGKTYFGLNHAVKNGAFRLICTEEMTDADLIGCYKQNNQGTWTFHEGVGIKAWRTGARLVVDEINRMNGDVESRMMALIDSTASSSWQNPDTQEIVKPHKDFSVVATMNGLPEDLAPAILDRLVVKCEVNSPHPEALASLPKYLQELAEKMTSPGMGHDRVSLRSFVEFEAMYRQSGNLEFSAQVVFPQHHTDMSDVIRVSRSEAKLTPTS